MIGITEGISRPKGLRVVIYGSEGIGKTTLANKLGNGLFLDYENGTRGMNVATVTTVPKTYVQVKGLVAELTKDHHGKDFLIIDSADKFEGTLAKSLAAEKKCDDIFACNDYGRTVAVHKGEMGQILDRLSDLAESGMNVVIVAHEISRKYEPLEGHGATYDRHELKLSKTVAPMFKEWADVLIFTAYKDFAIVDDKTHKAHAGGGARWCYTVHTNEWDAKHRACIELPDDCSLDKMTDILPKAIASAVSQVKPESAKTAEFDVKVAKQKVKAVKESLKELVDANPGMTVTDVVPAKDVPKADETAHIADLRDAISQFGLSTEEFSAYAKTKLVERFGLDADMPMSEWPEKVAAWFTRGMDKIAAKITGCPF